jgi:hypothetical protein
MNISLAVLAHLHEGYPNHLKVIKCVTNSILLTGYYYLTTTVLKDLPNTFSGLSKDIYLFVPRCINHHRSQLQIIQFLLQNTKSLSDMISANSSMVKISEATYNNLLKDRYYSSKQGNCTPLIV